MGSDGTAGTAELHLQSRVERAPDVPRRHLLSRLNDTQAALMGAVLAGEGMERAAELAAAGVDGAVAMVVPRLGVSVIARADGAPAGGEDPDADGGAVLADLERWVVERMRGRPAAVPPAVGAVAPVSFRDQTVGVVALVGAPSSTASETYEFLRLAAAGAFTRLAIEDAKAETEETLRGAFLEELRSRDDLTAPEIVRRAARLGCDVTRGGVVLCAELTVNRPGLVAAMITSEHPGALAQEVAGEHATRRLRVYGILPALGIEAVGETSLASARRLAERLLAYAGVGVSSFHADPAELGGAVREAELALEVFQHSGATISEEIGSGIYKLLFRVLASHPDEVREFYESTVAPMVHYDGHNQTELVTTLWAYLDSNCNMNATAATIFAHRHTIAYRLERIHELTGLDPTQSRDREELALGLKVHRLLAPTLADPPRPRRALAVR